MHADSQNSLQPGDRVYDRYQKAHPDEDVKELIVLEVHPEARADEFPAGPNGESLAEVAGDWPDNVWGVSVPGEYDADADSVVEAVFHESLDRAFLGAWVEWTPEKVKRMCGRNDVTVYSYHRERLTTQR